MTGLQHIQAVLANLDRAIKGKSQVTELVLLGLLARGHVLIEDVPGVGKTTLANSLARSLACSFKRIQFTSDLLPSDVLGVSIFNQQDRTFEFKAGPIFANIVLADEINRSTPKTQSSLLEAMGEGQVSVDNVTHVLPRPFMVIATQNPVEYHGTHPLPESQLDRFMMRVQIGYPEMEDERLILRHDAGFVVEAMQPVVSLQQVQDLQDQVEKVTMEDTLVEYLLTIVSATRSHRMIRLGVSPRGTLALYRAAKAMALIRGRDYCLPDDMKYLASHVLSHRIMLRSSGSEFDHGTAPEADHVIREIVESAHVPL